MHWGSFFLNVHISPVPEPWPGYTAEPGHWQNILSVKGGRWVWLPLWASWDPRGRVREEIETHSSGHPIPQGCGPPPYLPAILVEAAVLHVQSSGGWKGKSVCQGSSPCVSPGALLYIMLKSGKGQCSECLSQAGRVAH